MITQNDLFPYKVEQPIPFAHINVGEVFQQGTWHYRLLSRDAFSVRVLAWFPIYDWVLSIFGRKIVRSGEHI